jgi:hypothetical protein
MARLMTQEQTKRNERKTPVCPRCGAEIRIGDWPWCPHTKLKPSTRLWNRVK